MTGRLSRCDLCRARPQSERESWEEVMESAIERQTMRQIYLRLLPFCFVLYFICYLDRVNIGFAALTMNKDLGLSSYVFGLGAGAFFWVISFLRCRAI